MTSPGVILAGRYRLDHHVDSGGMASVWVGHDLVLNRRIAVKLLHAHLSTDQDFIRRFQHEAESVANLSHPAIVPVHDVVVDGVHQAIIMEFVDAVTLREYLDDTGTVPVSLARSWCIVIADALDQAHRHSMVHRDLKPANILIDQSRKPHLVDFGIAFRDNQTDLTQVGSVIGTARYLSPEQAQGVAVDGRSDLYSLGLVLYEALSGSLPFPGSTDAELVMARLSQNPRPLSDSLTYQDPLFCAAVMRCIESDAAKRWQTAAELRRALESTEIAISTSDPTPTEGHDEPFRESTHVMRSAPTTAGDHHNPTTVHPTIQRPNDADAPMPPDTSTARPSSPKADSDHQPITFRTSPVIHLIIWLLIVLAICLAFAVAISVLRSGSQST